MFFVIVHSQTGQRLCQDGQWRTFANFGTYPSCVRVYRRKASVIRRARQTQQAAVYGLPAGMVMDASGAVIVEASNTTLFDSILQAVDYRLDPRHSKMEASNVVGPDGN